MECGPDCRDGWMSECGVGLQGWMNVRMRDRREEMKISRD